MACIFDEDNIQLNIQFDNKYDAIKEAGKILLNRDCIEPEYIDAMIEREDKVSVYIGNGVAIPHGVGGSEKYIKKSGLSFLQIPEGIDFGDGKIAYLVIGIAGVDGEHLDILANIAVTCSDVEKVEREKKLQETLVQIKHCYGKNAIFKRMNALDFATAKKRNVIH